MQVTYVDIDPYFFLGVTPEDDVNFITKVFRKKAKRLHPDKHHSTNAQEKEHIHKQFQLLVQCYEHILHDVKTRESSLDLKKKFATQKELYSDIHRTDDTHRSSNDVEHVCYDTNGFGYGVHKRYENVDDYEQKPIIKQIFDDKFDAQIFNKVFEYNASSKSKSNKQSEKGLVNRTTDGFFGLNSCPFEFASVHSYNGLLLVGDDLGETGVGYYGSHFSDLKQSFDTSRNPTVLPSKAKLDNTHQRHSHPDVAKSRKKYNHYSECMAEALNNTPSCSFTDANKYFEQKKRYCLQEDIQADKKFVNKYIDMFPQQLLQKARNNKLSRSRDTFCDSFNPVLSIEENLYKDV